MYTEVQGLVEVNLLAILDPFGSNQFMSCPWAMSLFQRLCPVPFSPVSFPTQRFYSHILYGKQKGDGKKFVMLMKSNLSIFFSYEL